MKVTRDVSQRQGGVGCSFSPTALIWRLLRFLAPFPGRVALSVFFGFGAAGANIGLLATSGLLIAKAALHPATILFLWLPIVGVRFFGLSRVVFRYAERLVSHDVTLRLLQELRLWLFRRFASLLPFAWHERRSGDVLGTAIDDVETLQTFYLRVLAPSLTALFGGGAGVMVLFFCGRKLALVMLAGLIGAGVGIPLLTHRLSRFAGKARIRIRGELQTLLFDTLEGSAEVLAFQREGAIFARWQRKMQQWVYHERWLAWVEGGSHALMALVQQMTLWLVLIMALKQIQSERLAGVYLPMMVMTVLAAFETVISLPFAWKQMGECEAAGERLFSLGHRSPSSEAAAFSLSNRPMKRPLRADLEVRQLSYRYPGAEREALSAVSFSLPQGKHVAVVGASGAGKSTLLHLLLRLMEPTAGTITLDGVNLREMEEEEVCRYFSLLEQKAYLFHDTAADNVRLARPEAGLAEIRQAAQQAGVDAVIKQWPLGYATLLGEKGMRMSGGEQQRLAFARALLKEAPILLLDEPTRGLDALSEQRFFRILRQVAEGRSVLLVTHRLQGLEGFDEILVLHEGRLVERGTHRELIERRGLYHALWVNERERLLFQEGEEKTS